MNQYAALKEMTLDGPVWVNADKIQPSSDAKVLIWPGRYGNVSIGWYEKDEDGGCWYDATEWRGDEGSFTPAEVQRWMPLPPEPVGVPRRETIYTISWQW